MVIFYLTILFVEKEKTCSTFPGLIIYKAISKTRNGEWRNGERGTGNGERGISKRGNL